MGLSDFKRGRTSDDAGPQRERRNGDGPIVDDSKAAPALVLGRALLDAVCDIVEEVLRRREEAREDHPSESVAADDSHDIVGEQTDDKKTGR